MTQDIDAAISDTSSTLQGIGLADGGKKFGRELRKDFLFDEGHINLNHGSFGTYPRTVRSELLKFQETSEACPDQHIRYNYPSLLDASRLAVSKVLNTQVENVVFVPNATTGVNTIFRSLRFEPGDKIVYFDFIYGACAKTVQYIEETTPAKGVEISNIALPCEPEEIVKAFTETILSNGGGSLDNEGKADPQRKPGESRVRIAVFDTVVSQPGVRLPFEELVKVCKEVGVLSLVDAAHGIGHIPLDLAALDPDFLVSNCHKWLYVPRGCAAFYVPVRHQHLITSMPTSHGFTPTLPTNKIHINPLPPSRTPKSPWVQMFEFTGTIDTSNYLCVPSALAYLESLGGEAKVIEYNISIAQRGAQLIAQALGTEVMENKSKSLGKCPMAMVRLPLAVQGEERGFVPESGDSGVVFVKKERVLEVANFIEKKTAEEFRTFIPVVAYRGWFYARVCGQVYLDEDDFKYGGEVLNELVGRVRAGNYY